MSWLGRKLARFSLSGEAKIIVWRSTGGAQFPFSEGVSVREVGLPDVEQARSMEDETTIQYLKSVMGQGYHAWFAFCDGIVVHRSLMLPGPAAYNLWRWTARLDVPANEGVILGCATHPQYGGRGIYASVLSFIANDPRWSGVWGFTETDNLASRRGLTKAGFREHHLLTVRAWHGFARVRRSSV